MNTLIDANILDEITRPYTGSKIRKRDKPLSFSISVILHVAVFGLAGISFIKPTQFAVDKGLGSIEVNLVAASSEVVPQEVIEVPVEAKSEFVEKEIVKPIVKMVEQQAPVTTQGKDQQTIKSMGGAISEAKPDYLQNPAPAYPEAARRRGHQGTVLLLANIDKSGVPVRINLEKSSGHALLDDAAIKAVKTWKFNPAKLGDMPIESTVRVPIKFNLNEI